MSDQILKEIKVYSEKYDIYGIIKDYGFVSKLLFSYEGKDILMGIHGNPLVNEDFEVIGRKTIESYIENLASGKMRKHYLHYWYINDMIYKGETIYIGHGIVTGHKKIMDSSDMSTSMILDIKVDEDEGEVLLTTMNNLYHCPLAYCDFDEQDKKPDIIPNYRKLKKKYRNKIEYPAIEPGKVLLVIADFCNYYFHSLYYVPKDSKDGKKIEFRDSPHIGTFQDSYLIEAIDHRVDLRYFPHYQNIEFYSESVDDCPWYIENIGSSTIFAETSSGTIKLEAGDRKEVRKENAEKEEIILPRGDLYPAGVI